MANRYWSLIGFLCAASGLALLWRSFAANHFWIFLRNKTPWRRRNEAEQEPSGDPSRKKRRATTLWQRKNEAERIRDEAERLYKERIRRLMGVALVIVVALGLWLGSLWRASNQSRDRVEEELIALLGRPAARPGMVNTNLAIDPELKKALIEYFRNPPKPGEGFPWWLVVIGAIAAGALFFTTKEHPSAAPFVVVLPLAIAAVEHAEHLSKLCKGGFWGVAVVSLVIAGALIGVGIRRERGLPPMTDRTGPGGEKKQLVSFVTMGFSMLILVWTFVVVGSCTDCSGCTGKGEAETPKCPNPPPPASSPQTGVLKVIPLEPLPLFKAGSSRSVSGVDRLAQSLADKHPKENDVLLLLGSADCTRNSKGNQQLVLDRAAKVSADLGPFLHKARVDDGNVLPQYKDGCRENKDLRTVFSFLIQQQETAK